MSDNSHYTFDTQAAKEERLAWRLDGEQPTERALGIDEAEARDIKSMLEELRMRRRALGEVATNALPNKESEQ